MVYQTNWNQYTAYKAQSALNTQASGGSAKVLRTTGGTGMKMSRGLYASQEVRRDAVRTRGRHGARSTAGVYPSELIKGHGEDILAAIMRASYSAADLEITEATSGGPTEITTTTSTIVGNSGSWITAGVRANEVWRLTNHATAANNSKNLLVIGVTATTITVAGTPLTLNAVADTAFTLTRVGRKLTNPAAGSLAAQTYFTIEDYEADIDGSEIFTDCLAHSMKLGKTKDGIVTCEYGFMGTGAFETKTGASAPHFTSPSENTNPALAVVDAAIYYNGTAVADLVSFDFTMDTAPERPPTTAVVAPDVLAGQMGINMNLTVLRPDLSKLADFANETSLSLNLLAVENESEPKDFVLINVPFFILGDVAKSAISQAGGARTQTLSIPEGAIGRDTTGGALDSTMVKFQVSTSS